MILAVKTTRRSWNDHAAKLSMEKPSVVNVSIASAAPTALRTFASNLSAGTKDGVEARALSNCGVSVASSIPGEASEGGGAPFLFLLR